MIEWITIISLILIGLVIVLVEIIFVPGTTLIGLLGFVFMVAGVGLGFRYFGNVAGWIITGSTIVVSTVSLFIAFRANVWGKFSLKSSSNSKVNEGELESVSAGQEGVTLSALRPVGKAELNSKTFEVRTMGKYLEAGTRIRVLQINAHQIIVEPLS
ncbi:MAG: hypothetical protein JST14_10980 [Bacteroidetes bacterium]|nr:hypothetical protein [Bacteroidota bacterium]MBS1978848.1 hypothetical protein [Bacteroidota bacterium]